MAEQLYRVELTASFLERLDAIEAFLMEADAGFAFDALLAELRATVIPNLRRFPRMGRRYLANPPQSTESLARLAALAAGAPDALREYLHGDYLILYTVRDAAKGIDATVYLLSCVTTDSCRLTSLGYGRARTNKKGEDACRGSQNTSTC